MGKVWSPPLSSLPTRHYCSFDSLIQPDEEGETLNLSDSSDFRDEIDERLIQKGISKILSTLNWREELVIRIHLLYQSPEPPTLQSTSEKLGVTRERVRQIILKALRSLRHPERARMFKEVVDNSAYGVYTRNYEP